MNWSLTKSNRCESSHWLIRLKTDGANRWVAANRHCRWAHTLACCSAPCAVEDSDNVSQCYFCFVFLWQFKHLKEGGGGVCCFCVCKLVNPLTQPSIKLHIRIKMKQNAYTVLLGKNFPSNRSRGQVTLTEVMRVCCRPFEFLFSFFFKIVQ